MLIPNLPWNRFINILHIFNAFFFNSYAVSGVPLVFPNSKNKVIEIRWEAYNYGIFRVYWSPYSGRPSWSLAPPPPPTVFINWHRWLPCRDRESAVRAVTMPVSVLWSVDAPASAPGPPCSGLGPPHNACWEWCPPPDIHLGACAGIFFIFLFRRTTTSTFNYGYSVEVTNDSEKNYYCGEKGEDEEWCD